MSRNLKDYLTVVNDDFISQGVMKSCNVKISLGFVKSLRIVVVMTLSKLFIFPEFQILNMQIRG